MNSKKDNTKYKVLAISFGHESNACLMINGKLISYAAEERFNKKKHLRVILKMQLILLKICKYKSKRIRYYSFCFQKNYN